MSFHDEPGLTPAADVTLKLQLVWSRRGGRHGVEFTADHPDGRALVVKKVFWVRPGFSGKKDSGWAAFVSTSRTEHKIELEQEGAAYPRACDAQLHIERVTKVGR